MSDDEEIARYLATKGATACPPGWAAATSNALPTLPANLRHKEKPWQGYAHHRRELKKQLLRRWAGRQHHKR